MKILVTGSSGFIGKRFCNLVESYGHKVIKFDLPKRDILRPKDLHLVIEKCDMVVHFAALADLNKSIDRLHDNFNVNVNGTLNVALNCRRYSKPLIFCSTCCVYGNHAGRIAIENKTLPACIEPYARSKVAAENIVMGMPDLKWMILRPGTVYGPGMRDELFTKIVFDKLFKNEFIEIHGSGKQNRRFVHVDDLVYSFYLATQKFNHGFTLNVCGSKKYSVLDVINIASKITGITARVKHVKDRFGQTYDERISIKKAKYAIGWAPEIDFYNGMEQFYDEYFDKRK